jgi:hypothetical protein
MVTSLVRLRNWMLLQSLILGACDLNQLQMESQVRALPFESRLILTCSVQLAFMHNLPATPK